MSYFIYIYTYIHTNCDGFVICPVSYSGTTFPRTPFPVWFLVIVATGDVLPKIWKVQVK